MPLSGIFNQYKVLLVFNISRILIVTTSTTPRNQNEDEDGDGDAVLRQVAVQVDDVTP